MLRRLASAVLAVAVVAGACAENGPRPLNVAAAASLTEALTEFGSIYQERERRRVDFNFSGSSTLARQILSGAPVDVFVSADARQMDRVERDGALLPGTRQIVAGNALVIVVPGSGAEKWEEPRRLLSSEIEHLALADVEAVPAGVYAREWLQRIGLWDRLKPKVVPAANVRAALAAVDTASADAAIVYRTDARVPGDRSIVYEVPQSDAPRIAYHAAVVAQSVDPAAARRFVELLAGDIGRDILIRQGFIDGR